MFVNYAAVVYFPFVRGRTILYIPKQFQIYDQTELVAFIQSHSFGILFSQTANGPVASHLPFLIEESNDGTLLLTTHMAKANTQWKKAQNSEVLVVFQGPHTYISPTWYGPDYHAVPTWNYAAVHASGKMNILEDEAGLISILQKMTAYFEASLPVPWKPDFEQSKVLLPMTKAIIGVQIEITSLEGKWKLSQNHPAENLRQVVQALDTLNDPDAALVAKLMRKYSIPEM